MLVASEIRNLYTLRAIYVTFSCLGICFYDYYLLLLLCLLILFHPHFKFEKIIFLIQVKERNFIPVNRKTQSKYTAVSGCSLYEESLTLKGLG